MILWIRKIDIWIFSTKNDSKLGSLAIIIVFLADKENIKKKTKINPPRWCSMCNTKIYFLVSHIHFKYLFPETKFINNSQYPNLNTFWRMKCKKINKSKLLNGKQEAKKYIQRYLPLKISTLISIIRSMGKQIFRWMESKHNEFLEKYGLNIYLISFTSKLQSNSFNRVKCLLYSAICVSINTFV